MGEGMVIVDTSVWFDYFAGATNPETEWLQNSMEMQRLGITDLILCEILQGVRTDAQFQKLYDDMLEYEVFATGGREIAIAAAENYRLLRKKGFAPRKTIDCWIATFCLLEGHTLLHRDRDFLPFEKELGLLVVHA
jgi:predicted nucleic acid-binding protein